VAVFIAVAPRFEALAEASPASLLRVLLSSLLAAVAVVLWFERLHELLPFLFISLQLLLRKLVRFLELLDWPVPAERITIATVAVALAL